MSFEHLDGLRRQNKELLQRLKQNTENLQRLRLECSGKKSTVWKSPERSAGDRRSLKETNGSLLNVSGDFMNLTVSGNFPIMARSVLCKSISNRNTLKTEIGCSTDDEGKHLSGTMELKPVILQDECERVTGEIRFPTEDDDEQQSLSEAERRRVQPLLGYDWIAGLLDTPSSLSERSEQFFSELHNFRQVHREECVHSVSSGIPDATALWPPPVEDDVSKDECAKESHQCTFCYRINSRLFAVPLEPQAACPICKMPKEKHPHTENQPAFIRVSIPRTTLLPEFHYKAHRRCSFDPSDSLGLPSHCLSGWTNISMGARAKMSILDLRSSVGPRTHPGTEPSAQDESNRDVSGFRASGRQRTEQLPEVSRLARYQFQHGTATRTKPFY